MKEEEDVEVWRGVAIMGGIPSGLSAQPAIRYVKRKKNTVKPRYNAPAYNNFPPLRPICYGPLVLVIRVNVKLSRI